MKGYRLTAAAEADLARIFWEGLERFGAAQTERYLSRLELLFDDIAEFPKAVRLRTELTPAVFAYPVDAHIIIYAPEPNGVAILRIRSARENWSESPLGEDQ